LRDRISFSQLRKLSGVSSNETLYKCFDELKEDVEKTVVLSYGKDWKSPKVKNKDYIWEKIPEVICLKDV
jgi:hypothetical protein